MKSPKLSKYDKYKRVAGILGSVDLPLKQHSNLSKELEKLLVVINLYCWFR